MSQNHVILLALDSLRLDRLSCYGSERVSTDNIDTLASDGKRFEYAVATGSWTVPSHGSIFTGKYPSQSGINKNNPFFHSTESLASTVSDLGYSTVGVSANPWITTQFGYDDGFEYFYDMYPPLPHDSVGDPRTILRKENIEGKTDKYLRLLRWAFESSPYQKIKNMLYVNWVEKYPICPAGKINRKIESVLNKRSHPIFLFANYMDAHEPYPYRDARNSKSLEQLHDFDWNLRSLINPPDKTFKSDIIDSYDESVRYLDQSLGELFRTLKQRGIYEESHIILFSDHGQSLGESGYWGHGTLLDKNLVHIPLIIKPANNSSISFDIQEQPISLINLFDWILNIVKCEVDSAAWNVKNITEDLDPAISESVGPHQDVQFSHPKIPQGVVRKLYIDAWTVLKNVDTGEVDVTEGFFSEESISKQEAVDVLNNTKFNSKQENNNDNSIDPNTKDRLERLGYL